MGNRHLVLILLGFIFGCKEDKKTVVIKEVLAVIEEPKEVLEFGFNHLGLSKTSAYTADDNPASISILKQFDFIKTDVWSGTHRKHFLIKTILKKFLWFFNTFGEQKYIMKKSLFISVLAFFISFGGLAQSKAVFYTTQGDFTIYLEDTLSPITAGNFIKLVNEKYYDGVVSDKYKFGYINR